MLASSFVTKLSFRGLYARLLDRLAERVSNGEFSERQLAAKLGISQPQIHRLLKGSRRLTQEVADIILTHLDLSILDLLDADEIGPRAVEANPLRKQPGRQQPHGSFRQHRSA